MTHVFAAAALPSAQVNGSAISERDTDAEPLPACIPLPLQSAVDRDSQSGAFRQGLTNKDQGFHQNPSRSLSFTRGVPRTARLSSPNYVQPTTDQTHAIPMSADQNRLLLPRLVIDSRRSAAHDSSSAAPHAAAALLPASDWLDWAHVLCATFRAAPPPSP